MADQEDAPHKQAGIVTALKMIFEALRARSSYTTRVWTALLLPIASSTAFDWSTAKTVQMLALSVSVVAVYTITQWIWKRYLK
jgi:hypothetical protein